MGFEQSWPFPSVLSKHCTLRCDGEADLTTLVPRGTLLRLIHHVITVRLLC